MKKLIAILVALLFVSFAGPGSVEAGAKTSGKAGVTKKVAKKKVVKKTKPAAKRKAKIKKAKKADEDME